MSVCKARNCKKRELCGQYIKNYFEHHITFEPQQLIDWSSHGSCNMAMDEEGNWFVNEIHDCGDKSITYPLFDSMEYSHDTSIAKVERIRYAKWITKKIDGISTIFSCSNCKREIKVTNDYFGKPTEYVNILYPYCHCGAKMDA